MSMSPEETAFEQGYKAYYNGIDNCPYDSETQLSLWHNWYDGFHKAYIEDEDK